MRSSATLNAPCTLGKCIKILNMIQLRLTQKVQKAAGLKPENLSDIKESSLGLGSWTLNLFNQDRRKVLIFVNDRTLYSFILFGVRKEHYRNLAETFQRGFQQLLITDGFKPHEQEYLLEGTGDVGYSKTGSKKVLGNLNDLVWHYKYLISDAGGLEYADIGNIIGQLNRMPQRNIEWAYSVDAVKAVAADAQRL